MKRTMHTARNQYLSVAICPTLPAIGVLALCVLVACTGRTGFTKADQDDDENNISGTAAETDGHGDIQNVPPTLVHHCSEMIMQDSAYACAPTAQDEDAGNTHTWSLAPIHNCAWLGVDPETGTLGGIPNDDDVGTCALAFRVNDGIAYSTDVVIEITVVNLVPTLSILDAPPIAPGAAGVEIRDDLSVQASDEPYGVYSLAIQETSAPRCVDHGTVNIHPETGAVVFSPAVDFTGACNIGVAFDDGNQQDSRVVAGFSTSVTTKGLPESIALYGPAVLEIDECTEYLVQREDLSGTAAASVVATEIELTHSGTGAFYSGSSCNQVSTSTTIGFDRVSSSVWYMAPSPQTVTLTATDAGATLGGDSISARVVGRHFMCNGLSTTERTGFLFDSGGPTANYSDSENCTYLIEPDTSETIRLDFVSFRAIGSGDSLAVYDGVDSSGILLGRFDGNTPPLTRLKAASGAAYFEWNSSNSQNDRGYEVAWSAYASSQIVLTGPTTIDIQDCREYRMELRNSSSVLVTEDFFARTRLSDTGSGTFYADSGCTVAATISERIPPGVEFRNIYFRDSVAEITTLMIDEIVSVLPAATLDVTVVAGPPDHLTVEGKTLVPEGSCTAYVIYRHDVANNPVLNTSDSRVGLDTEIPGMLAFYSAAGCTSQVNELTIPGAATSQTVYVRNLAPPGIVVTLFAEDEGGVLGAGFMTLLSTFHRVAVDGDRLAVAGDFNGDGTDDIIVGSPRFDGLAGLYSGKISVFSGADGSLIMEREGETVGDAFGSAISKAGDWNGDGRADIAVGAPGFSTGGQGSYRGKVYVYSGMTQELLIALPGESGGDRFGAGLHAMGDFNGDGLDDVAVGVPGFGDIYSRGKVSVISAFDGAELWALDNPHTGAIHFGTSITTGDFDNDGTTDLVVGDYGEDGAGTNSQNGRVSIFSGIDDSRLFTDTGTWQDKVGWSVVNAGDFNNDGVDDLAYSLPNGNTIMRNGQAVVVTGSTFTKVFDRKGLLGSDRYGAALGALGDVNGDGYAEVVVGGDGMDGTAGQTDAGRVMVYDGQSRTLLFEWGGEQALDRMGGAVACLDIDGDGILDVAVLTRGTLHIFPVN